MYLSIIKTNQTMTTTFKISKVNQNNKYKGSYEKIFSILNEDRIFTEVYETEESIGLINEDYFLEISETPDANLLEKILKLKNVTLVK